MLLYGILHFSGILRASEVFITGHVDLESMFNTIYKENSTLPSFLSYFSILLLCQEILIDSSYQSFLKEWIFTKIEDAAVESAAKNCVCCIPLCEVLLLV